MIKTSQLTDHTRPRPSQLAHAAQIAEPGTIDRVEIALPRPGPGEVGYNLKDAASAPPIFLFGEAADGSSIPGKQVVPDQKDGEASMRPGQEQKALNCGHGSPGF